MELLQSEPNADLNYCAINGFPYLLSEIEKLGYNEFTSRTLNTIPDKLYKFFPNKWETEQDAKRPVNYSHQALINNRVYMQSPNKFDDIYDSDLHIKWEEYSKIRLRTYCQYCNCDIDNSSSYAEMLYKISMALYNAIKEKNDISAAFVNAPYNELNKLRNKVFLLAVESELLREMKRGKESRTDWQDIIDNILYKEYSDHTKELRRSFRISCFTTSPYSQLMWGGAYADSHRGFCVEYQIDKVSENYKELLLNLFPVIYCKSRPNMSERLTKIWDDGKLTMDGMWDIYFHGALRKSYEWIQQNEWRLIFPKERDSTNLNILFFPISKVFLGNRMAKKDRADIISICNDKSIPYVGVRRSDDVFEIKDCDIICEKCPNFLE
jgi:hypothetical protein